MKNKIFYVLAIAFFLSTVACTPEVGTKAWCEDMKEKPKGDWSANEAKEYASNCVFSDGKDE